MCAMRVNNDEDVRPTSQTEHHEEVGPVIMAPITSPTRPRPNEGTSTRSPLQTILIFSAVLAPLTLIPYALSRRQFKALHSELEKLRLSTAISAKENRAGLLEHAKYRKEFSSRVTQLLESNKAQLAIHGSLLEDCKQLASGQKDAVERMATHLDTLGGTVKGYEEAVHFRSGSLQNRLTQLKVTIFAREAHAKAWREETTKSVQALLENTQRRVDFSAEVRDLGASLADVAAFVEEVEMRQGWAPRPEDGRGIERMRNLAKRLDDIATAMSQTQTSPIRSSQEESPTPSSREGDSPPVRQEATPISHEESHTPSSTPKMSLMDDLVNPPNHADGVRKLLMCTW